MCAASADAGAVIFEPLTACARRLITMSAAVDGMNDPAREAAGKVQKKRAGRRCHPTLFQ
jgi:hypothetical protein